MQKTSIEWVKNPDGSQGYTWNPITGCLNGCSYCYARKLANGRLKYQYLANSCLPTHDEPNHEQHHEDPFYPRFWASRLNDFGTPDDYGCQKVKHPKGIFACDMSDWCGIGIPEAWSNWILEMARRYPEHRFYLLTKQPQNLPQFSPFPDNCWVGVTATNNTMFQGACHDLHLLDAKIKFISLEPLLDWNMRYGEWMAGQLLFGDIDWLIIGGQTKPTVYPKIEWVKEIVDAADRAEIPVFLKDNLKPLLATKQCLGERYVPMPLGNKNGYLRQEIPA